MAASISMQQRPFAGTTSDLRTARDLSGFIFRPVRHCPVRQTFRHKSAIPRGSNETMLNTSDSIRSTRTQDGRILLDVRHGQMFSLNVVGSKILELIEQGWDEARIAVEISQAYATTIEVARTDVHEFIEVLRRHSILQANGSGDSI
jgi:hypothetical protein